MKRHELKEIVGKTIKILNQIFDPQADFKKIRHVDDNQLVLTKEQSLARLNNLCLTLWFVLFFLTTVLIFLSSYFSREIRYGKYFHENKTEAMRTQKLFLVHYDGKTQKLGLSYLFYGNDLYENITFVCRMEKSFKQLTSNKHAKY